MTYHRLQAKPKVFLDGKHMGRSIFDEEGLKVCKNPRPNIRVQTHVQRPWALLICIAWTIALSVFGMLTVFTVVTERL